MAYRLTYSDYAGNTASPSPPAPTPAPTGNGYRLRYSDYPGTAEGPPDPLRWIGPPGPQGPPGPASTYTLPTASTTVLGGVKVDGSSITIASGVISSAAAAAAVTSWNTRTGAVTLTSGDVTTALTFTPYNSTNPSGYQTAAQVGAAITAGAYVLPTASTTVLGGVKIDGTTVTIAAGVITVPTDISRYAASNPSGYQTAANVTTALAAGQPGAFSTLSASATVSGAGFTTLLAPYQTLAQVVTAIAAGNPGAFSTLSASGAVSGAGFSTYLASPPAIGGTAAAAGAFTTLTASGNTTIGSPVGSQVTLNANAGFPKHIIFSSATSTRWDLFANIVAEGGSNAGSDLVLDRYTDAGAFLGNALTITRATGAMAVPNTLTVGNPAGCQVNFNANAGFGRHFAFQSAASQRWDFYVDGSAEGGANAGSNMGLDRYTDAGAFLGTVFTISRATGATTFNNPVTFSGSVASPLQITDATAPLLLYSAAGQGNPTVTTRSVGTKIVLYPTLSGTQVDMAIGYNSGVLWTSVFSTAAQFQWFGGTTLAATLSGAGVFGVATGGSYQLGGTKVVGARITGWGTSTGGARGLITASSTLAQVAAGLSQLLTDLQTHGLLGT